MDKDEVTKLYLGGLKGEVNIINESGLYSLIIKSRKPGAKKFKRWVTHEVLPAIRKTGRYVKKEFPKFESDREKVLFMAQQIIEECARNEKLTVENTELSEENTKLTETT